MIPTLVGRWQTRFFLLTVIGIPVTLVYAWVLSVITAREPAVIEPLSALAAVLVIGLILDMFYMQVQRFRWDRDWPPIFGAIAGLMEGLIVFLLFSFFQASPANVFWPHYMTVFLTTFAVSLGGMQILFPYWRFRGGRWMK